MGRCRAWYYRWNSIGPKVALEFWKVRHRVEGHEDREPNSGNRQATTYHCHSLH